jgi:methionine synthase II (cobalamin-independent)
MSHEMKIEAIMADHRNPLPEDHVFIASFSVGPDSMLHFLMNQVMVKQLQKMSEAARQEICEAMRTQLSYLMIELS